MTARAGEGKGRIGMERTQAMEEKRGEAERTPGVTGGKHQKQARNAGLQGQSELQEK